MQTIDRFRHLPRDTRDTLFLLAVIGWIVAPQVPHLPLWSSLLAGAVLGWRGWLAWRGQPLPTRGWLIALLGLTLAGTWATHRTLLGREAGVTLIVTLLTLKTLELRARRDAWVVFFLGFFTLLTSFFHSQSLATAAAMLVALLGLLTALINAHRPVGRPSLRASATLAGQMALAGAPVMLALFVLFPRFAPLWGLPSDAQIGRSGLSASMEVGRMAELALDDGVALRVRFDGAVPPPDQLYFRGPVLSRFDGRRWSASGGLDELAPARPAAPDALQLRGAPVRYEVTLEPSQRPWLLTLDVAAQAPQLPAALHARVTPEQQWLATRPITELLRYRAESHPDYRLNAADAAPPDGADTTALPAGFNPRTLALAQQLRQQAPAGAADAIVTAALQRLRSGGYTYTLEPGVFGQHAADEFWFDVKQGFCEHIASAFVVLMRGAGVPARVVTGYQGGEKNPLDGYWTLRQSDAHAWAEVWLAGRGWVRVDPTGAVSPLRIGQAQRLRAPPGLMAGALNTLSPTLLAQLRAGWEAVNNRWNQWVLNYTQSRQFDLLRQLGIANPDWDDLAKLLGGLLLLAALAGMAWAQWERLRQDPWLRLLTQARAQLQRAGLASSPQATPGELMQHVRQSPLPAPLRTALLDWLQALERLRYAAPDAAGTRAANLTTLQRDWRRLRWPRPT